MTLLEIPPLPAELSALEPTRGHFLPRDADERAHAPLMSAAKSEYWAKRRAEKAAPKVRYRKLPLKEVGGRPTHYCSGCLRTYERQKPIGFEDYCPICSNPSEGYWRVMREIEEPQMSNP